MGTCAAAGPRFSEEAGVSVCGEDYGTSLIGDAVRGVGGDVIK